MSNSVDIINQLLPDEQSLAGIDKLQARIQVKIKRNELDITADINSAMSAHGDVVHAQNDIKKLATKMENMHSKLSNLPMLGIVESLIRTPHNKTNSNNIVTNDKHHDSTSDELNVNSVNNSSDDTINTAVNTEVYVIEQITQLDTVKRLR